MGHSCASLHVVHHATYTHTTTHCRLRVLCLCQFELSSTYVFGELVASFPDGVSDIATMKVSTTGIPTAATPCGGGSGSTCVADNDDDSSDGDVYADLPSSFFGKTVFAYVSVQFASASGTMDFTIEAVGHAATVLELNEAVSVDPRQSKGALSRQQMFKVAIDGGATPTAVVTMNSLVSSASMYIGTNIVPTTSTFSFRGDDDLGFDQKCVPALAHRHIAAGAHPPPPALPPPLAYRYQAELSNDGTSYILIVTTAPYSIEVEQSPLTGTQIAIVTLAVLAVVTVGCFCVGRKTCARAVDSDEVLRINSYMCFFVGAMVCIGPAIMFIVGMSMADVAPTVGVILPAIGGSVVAITLFFTGPTSVELNAKTQLCTIKRFYLIVWPLRTNSYPLNTIEHFYTTTHYSRNKNGGTSVTYAACVELCGGGGAAVLVSRVQREAVLRPLLVYPSVRHSRVTPSAARYLARRHMKLKNGSSVKVDAANSNVGGFRNCVERFNAFLRKADPSTQRNAATVGGSACSPPPPRPHTGCSRPHRCLPYAYVAPLLPQSTLWSRPLPTTCSRTCKCA